MARTGANSRHFIFIVFPLKMNFDFKLLLITQKIGPLRELLYISIICNRNTQITPLLRDEGVKEPDTF